MRISGKIFLAFFLSFVVIVSCDKEPDPIVVEADEDLYINEVYSSSGEDWIELYNATTETKDLSGYLIYDDPANKYPLPTGTEINADGFLVLICDDGASGLHTSFKLSSAGETLYLENADGKVIQVINVPPLVDGQSYGRFPDGSDDFGITGSPTRAASNGESQAALINAVTRSIMVPALDDAVEIIAEISSASAIESVNLLYSFDGGDFETIAMVQSAGNWEATIPAMNATGEVRYYITAENESGEVAKSPFDAPDDSYWYLLNTDALPALKINEFMAANASCCPDTDSGEEEFDDWIEIHNASANAINIGGMFLSDDANDPFKDRIPDDNPAMTTIPAGGYLLLWADESGDQGDLHLNFQLSASGETVGLFYKDGRAIDVYNFNEQQEDVSSGRTVDGGNTWQIFTNPTPGESNE